MTGDRHCLGGMGDQGHCSEEEMLELRPRQCEGKPAGVAGRGCSGNCSSRALCPARTRGGGWGAIQGVSITFFFF